MSTLKTDAITAVTADADLSLDGLGTGGVSIASTLKMTKGGDIASASPLVIDVDGNYFDVTGTTNFAAMTVEAGNFFMLQFDGALTITHGSGIELPGAANLTTATGDRLICYATAANTVEVMSVETEAAASAGFTLAAEQATTSGTSVTFGSIPAGVTMIIVSFKGVGTGGNEDHFIELGDSGGIETSGYSSLVHTNVAGSSETNNAPTDKFSLTGAAAIVAPVHGSIMLALERSSTNSWVCTGTLMDVTTPEAAYSGGSKSLSGELTQVKVSSTVTYNAGAVSIMYI